MSYHAIENLVEDAVHLVENTNLTLPEKRHLFYHLYRFQNLFDTGYTTLRCFDILQKNNYLQKLPIENHPDFHQHQKYFSGLNFNENRWIPGSLSQPEAELHYAQKEGEEVFFFPEFGSKLWENLFPDDGKPKAMTTTELILNLLEIAKIKGDEQLMKNLYISLVNGFLEGYLSDNQGFHQDFSLWLKDETLLSIRQFFTEYQLLKISKKEAIFEIPKLQEELEIADDTFVPKLYFLMDAKKSVSALQKRFEKEALHQEQTNIEWVKDYIGNNLKENGWIFFNTSKSENLKKIDLVFQKTVEEKNDTRPHQMYLQIEFDTELKGIYCNILFQHALLSEWQNIVPDCKEMHYHFKQDLYNIFSDANETFPEKKFNNYGLWRFDWKASEKTNSQKLKELFVLLAVAENIYSKKILRHFPEHFFGKTAEQYVELFEEMIYPPQDLLIYDLKPILLILIFDKAKQGNFEEAKHIIRIFEERLPPDFRVKNLWYRTEVVPFFSSINNGTKAELPRIN